MTMLKVIVQNLVLIGGLAIAAWASGSAATMVLSPRGALGPGVLQADSIVSGIIAVLIALSVSTVVAVVAGRVTNTAVGLFVLGGGLFGLAWRLETVHEIPFLEGFAGTAGALALETLIWAALVLGATLLVFRFSGPLRDVEPDEEGRRPHPLLSREALMLLGTGVLMLPVVWLTAQSWSKGQVIGAVFCGAMVVGLVGRLMAPHVQPAVLFAAPVLFGAIGHLVGSFLISGSFADVFVSGRIPKVNVIMPADYAA
ncbi:MAG: hypothetical protein GY715_08605, partial [Planctomycetes bacterium]|nr:hypothetical protein [Planctomycetota bacterium]